jgi:hypothetical protein
MLMNTPGPWQLVFGDPYDHGEDGHTDGFTILMAGARVANPEEDRHERIGKAFVIHEIRYADGIFPEDGGRSEAEANAHLIAAAPDLYDAVRQAAELFEDDEGISAVLRSALAKASGQG